MIDLPLVSVIVPCYNQGKFILDAITSVFSSTYKKYEIIIVNDGSTDPYTNQLLRNLNQPGIKVIQTENNGPSEARNTGIKGSGGKYILPLDADDKISPEYLKEAVNILESNKNIKLVTCDVSAFGVTKGKILLLDYSLENLLCQNTMVCSSMFRRVDYDKTKGFDIKMKTGLEDWDFWLSLLCDGGDVYKIQKIHFYYRIKKNSRNADLEKNKEKLKEMRYQIYLNHKELYSKHFFDPTKSFEYATIQNSREYKVGKIIMKLLDPFCKLL